MVANATFALKTGLCVRRARLAMVAPDGQHHRRCQAGFPLIGLSKFGQPPLTTASPASPCLEIIKVQQPGYSVMEERAHLIALPKIVRMDYGMTHGSIRVRMRTAVAGCMVLWWSVDW
jgi:hypothetical protein